MKLALVLLAATACKSKTVEPSREPPKQPEAAKPEAVKPPEPPKAPGYTTSVIALPGGTDDGVGMDYLLYDARTKAVWVPAGNTASVDVIDTATGKLTRLDGFPTKEMERNGKKRIAGPSSATLGDGVVYVGGRGDSSVCAIDDVKLAKGKCGTLDAMPDGIVYVAKTKEVWVTTPRDKSVRILDAATLTQKARIEFPGDPEGYAVDATRGRFYTNLEDKDQTLAVDLVSHKIVATWEAKCGEGGPHGLRLAEAEGFLLIACSARLEALDVAHDGAVVGTLDASAGLDDIDYADHLVYAGGAKAATLTIATLDAKGALTAKATVPTKEGARNGVVDADGKVYLAHGKGSEIVVVTPPRS